MGAGVGTATGQRGGLVGVSEAVVESLQDWVKPGTGSGGSAGTQKPEGLVPAGLTRLHTSGSGCLVPTLLPTPRPATEHLFIISKCLSIFLKLHFSITGAVEHFYMFMGQLWSSCYWGCPLPL